MLTPAFSSVLPDKLVSGQVFSVAVSNVMVGYLDLRLSFQGGFSSFYAHCSYLLACPIPPVGKAASSSCPLPLPQHRCAKFVPLPPRGILVQVAAKCGGC